MLPLIKFPSGFKSLVSNALIWGLLDFYRHSFKSHCSIKKKKSRKVFITAHFSFLKGLALLYAKSTYLSKLFMTTFSSSPEGNLVSYLQVVH